MKTIARAAALAAITLAACQAGLPDPAEGLTVRISLAGDQCSVASAEALVTAADLVAFPPTPLTVAFSTIYGRITSVPAGTARTVLVRAYGPGGLVVYEGSTVVDVVAGQATPATIALVRNAANCPAAGSTGDIDVTGTIGPGEPPTGDVLAGPAFAFPFEQADLTADGVVHFVDPSGGRIHRLDLATRQLLPDVVGTMAVSCGAVSPDGAVAYLGYQGGRMDRFDLRTGSAGFFAAAPATVSSMVVAGGSLFTVDDSGAWDTQSLFDRTTGLSTSSVDWRDRSRSTVFSPLLGRVYYLDSGVSPTDVHMVTLDLAAGTLGGDLDSPYHGDYSLPNPIRLLPDESGVLVGSGLIFSTADLTYRTSLGIAFQDAAFLGDRIYLATAGAGGTDLLTLSTTFDILETRRLPGAPLRLLAWNGQLVLVGQGASSLEIRFLAP